ncbi:MAG: PIN domain-containing protein [Pseudomonadota bacterium]|nr:PIN domain-containing protein [Pseudomonadota bacterium]
MMVIPDVNILLHAVNASSRQHPAARDWLETAIKSRDGVGLAWMSLLGFIRLSTRHAILPRPLDHQQALELVRNWVDHPNTRILHPTERHLQVLSRLLTGAGHAGNLTTDAHLAALAIEHGAVLASFDRDFARFSGLAFEPLV